MLGRTSKRFLWCWLLLLFYLTGSFSFFIAFQRHPSFFRELSLGFYTYFILPVQLIAEWFATFSFNLSRLSSHSLTASATVLSGRFLPIRHFLLVLFPHIFARFVTQMRAGTPHCACPQNVVPSGWRMVLNYSYSTYKTIGLPITPVSHEVLSH